MKFILLFGEWVVSLLALCELLCGLFALKTKNMKNILVASMSFGLAIDAFIMLSGVFIGVGSFLQNLSQIRYILHGLLVPLIIPIAFEMYGMSNKTIIKCVYYSTTVLVLIGVMCGIMTETECVNVAGILRYAQSDNNSQFVSTVSRLLSFGGVIPLIVVGLVDTIKHKKAYLLLSGLSMFILAAIAPATGHMELNFITTMIGEALMTIFFILELSFNKKTV